MKVNIEKKKTPTGILVNGQWPYFTVTCGHLLTIWICFLDSSFFIYFKVLFYVFLNSVFIRPLDVFPYKEDIVQQIRDVVET